VYIEGAGFVRLLHVELAPIVDDACYYILDTRQVVGNCALWWGVDGAGYTCNLAEAGLYTRAKAFGDRATDVPVHRDVAQANAVTHVRVEGLWRDEETHARLQAASAAKQLAEERNNELSESDLQEALEVNPFDGDFGPSDLTVLRDEIVTAAKEHRCSGCEGKIREGLRHRCRVEKSADDGLSSWRWCHDCTKKHVGYPYGCQCSELR